MYFTRLYSPLNSIRSEQLLQAATWQSSCAQGGPQYKLQTWPVYTVQPTAAPAQITHVSSGPGQRKQFIELTVCGLGRPRPGPGLE